MTVVLSAIKQQAILRLTNTYKTVLLAYKVRRAYLPRNDSRRTPLPERGGETRENRGEKEGIPDESENHMVMRNEKETAQVTH